MKIKKLVVENVRNIDKAELDNLGNIITIVGPNGSGKSSLLDAIRVFKSTHGFYSGYYGADMQRQYPEFITIGQDTANIEMEIEISDNEMNAIGSTRSVLQGKVIIDRPMNARPNGNDIQLLRKLFSQEGRGDERLGKIDHIPPERKFTKGPISSVSFDQTSVERDWQRMIDDTTQKFDGLKFDLWRMNYADMEATIKNISPHPHHIDGMRSNFKDLFGNIEFIGVHGGLNEIPRFLVETPRGQHEIDVLSSGQMEILMIFAYLERHKFTNSVILLDGPELHLNASIEKKIISYLRKLAEHGNQLWIATHSPEIINSFDKEPIYRFSGGSPNIVERVETKTERIKTLEALGATLFVQLISQLVVYVEGESDKDILTYFEPSITDYASFVPSSGVRASVTAVELLNEAARFENFRAIRDRDILSIEQIEESEKSSHSRIHIWRRHEIENYLLDAVALFEVLQEHSSIRCKTQFKDYSELEKELKRIADGLLSLVVAKRIERWMNSELFKQVKIDPKNLDPSLSSIYEKRLRKLQEMSESKLKMIREDIDKEIQKDWEQKWVELCPGKDILKEFCNQCVEGSSNTIFPILIEFLAKKIKQLNRVHPDVIRAIAMLHESKTA
jgi:predicted ATPase